MAVIEMTDELGPGLQRAYLEYSPAMPAPAQSPASLERQLIERLLDFERLDISWPRGRTGIERAGIGRERENALSEIAILSQRIATVRATTLADAAAQLRRLVVMADQEPRAHVLLSPPNARNLVASVLAVVEREADAAA